MRSSSRIVQIAPALATTFFDFTFATNEGVTAIGLVQLMRKLAK